MLDPKITVKCPKCGKQHQKALAGLKHNTTILCMCGTRITLSATSGAKKAVASIAKINDAIAKLRRK